MKNVQRSVCEIIKNKNHIVEHIIPFFEKNPIVGSKHLNYLIFKNAAIIIKIKEQLNPDRKVRTIFSKKTKNMNKYSDETGKE